jgi:hypothetical protein
MCAVEGTVEVLERVFDRSDARRPLQGIRRGPTDPIEDVLTSGALDLVDGVEIRAEWIGDARLWIVDPVRRENSSTVGPECWLESVAVITSSYGVVV